ADGQESYAVAQSTYNLAIVYEHSGQTDNAELFYKQAANLWETVLGPNHINVANSLTKLANIYANQSNARAAEETYLRALEIQQINFGPKHVAVADSLFNLGRVCMKQEKYDEAERFYRESAEIMEAELDNDNPRLAVALYSLANVYHIRAKHEAEYNTNFAAKLTPATDHTHDVALSSQRLAALRTQISLRQRVVRELYAKAEPLYQRAAAILTDIYGADYPTLKIIRDELTLLHQGQASPNSVSRAD
ncbi:MAG: tetratricopeptide repeat protein, partial [Gammaproteobacteria bacterium]|nr:tetratricopeptide repeat protein [Gammaproteobacteria bacterium]